MQQLKLRKKVAFHLSKQLFVQTEKQQYWLEKLATLEEEFKQTAQRVDEESVFPFENFKKLREIGYTKTTLPVEFGGEGFTVYDAVLIHETLSSYCGSTGLAASWTVQNIGELFENRYWEQSKLEAFAQEVNRGATINRAVSEFAMGSPVRGGRPATTAKKTVKFILLTGAKIIRVVHRT